MLIRLVDHFRDNPKRIDKLIAVKGIPEDWMFREGDSGKELKRPWEPDIDANIPQEIRHLCEPMYVVRRYPPLNNQSKEVIEKRQILGIRLDYNSEPGRQLWDDIERYIEESMPRNERIPVPVLCARDERSAFDTYTPRRTARGGLELVPSPVPMVDLTKYPQMVATAVERVELNPLPATETQTAKQNVEFKCKECDYHNASQRGISMHVMKRHSKKEKVSA